MTPGIAALGIAAMGGQSVAYVSCQEAPWLMDRLRWEGSEGWGDVIRGTTGLEEAMRQVRGLPDLKVLPIGQVDGLSHPFTGPEFEALLDTLAERFRYVLVDAPSFVEQPECRVLLQLVDAAEVVVRGGRSTKKGTRDLVRDVRKAGATLSGIVLLRKSKKYQ